MERVKTIVLLIFFALGLITFSLLMFYVVSGTLFVADTSIQYQGEIAFIPKWIYLFSVFVLLGKAEKVKKFLLRNFY